ncbi:hypothetical protein K469DRAFT_752491 [Zopfia rhizophila CBS 207.26]|uniref:Uncharacterized protein n=1 Tax=Zopfia rhizophila CBS 207.26 TaxID=1314779 RepID=A0A6A6DR87_9PEZI|nr:hypothetical protein K469DRAFT_752491 [Zopfia rhizophila CBS 207.26]
MKVFAFFSAISRVIGTVQVESSTSQTQKPDPPSQPPPRPGLYPVPKGKPRPSPQRPANPGMDDPKDEDREDEGQQCALEFGSPVPTYRPPPSTTLKPPPPPPTSSPPPPPDPPKPNPDMEEVSCYDSGSLVTREMAIDALNSFCSNWKGSVLDPSRRHTVHPEQW